MPENEKEIPEPEEEVVAEDETPDTDVEKVSTERATPIPAELLKRMPPDVRKEVQRMFVSMTGISGPMAHPLTEKLDGDHIRQIIENVENGEQRDHQEGKDVRRLIMQIFIGVLIFVSFIFVFFTMTGKTDLIRMIIPLLVSIVGGVGGGFGLSKLGK